MKGKLTEISLDSSNEFTEEQLVLLHKYYPTARFKVVDDFEEWGYKDKSPEEKEKIQQKAKEYLASTKKRLNGYDHKFVCDLHIFMHDFSNTKFTVLGTREINIDIENSDAVKLQQNAIDEMLKRQEKNMDSMMNKFIKMSERIAENLKVDTLNQKCDVHIGGGLLMTVNEILLSEDACTDQLQSDLNSGWRILAVSVQPDSRRPDYVLGRFNPDLNVDGSAKR